MSDKPKRATFEQLLNGDVSQVSIINEGVNFVVDFTVPKAESALEIAPLAVRASCDVTR